MKTKVVLSVHTVVKYKFQNISRWFAALSLPLLDWKKSVKFNILGEH